MGCEQGRLKYPLHRATEPTPKRTTAGTASEPGRGWTTGVVGILIPTLHWRPWRSYNQEDHEKVDQVDEEGEERRLQGVSPDNEGGVLYIQQGSDTIPQLLLRNLRVLLPWMRTHLRGEDKEHSVQPNPSTRMVAKGFQRQETL